MKAYVVIGANYGDEGKGHITNFATKLTKANIVCRFNGGGQAGHTVNNGIDTHVFKSISSGTFSVADTYLSEEFVLNPYTFSKEIEDLNKIGYSPKVYIHADAKVTTIYDMAINAIAEISRGENRHGSCGLGFNETITRSVSGFSLSVKDIFSDRELVDKLKKIHQEWVPFRMSHLGLTSYTSEIIHPMVEVLSNDNYQHHANIIRNALNYLYVTSTDVRHLVHNAVVFEGAQGLGLDQYLGEFPHVTRSCTGLSGAIHAFSKFGITTVQPIYVTRAYNTRHGAGPLLHESEIDHLCLEDNTNKTNEWQGKFRYAPLDIGFTNHLIHKDWINAKNNAKNLKIEAPVIAMTCLDQLDAVVSYDEKGIKMKHNTEDFMPYFEEKTNLRVAIKSYGPKQSDISLIKNIFA